MSLKGIRIFLRSVVIALIEKVSLSFYITIYIIIVFGLGVTYYLLTPSANGLIPNGCAKPVAITFGTALYYSVITVTTVGYGDLAPIGYGRAIASFEALFGLTMLGIILAKITSGRLSYHVLRLFWSDVQARLEVFSALFEKIEAELSHLSRQVREAFQGTPGGAPEGAQAGFLAEFTSGLTSMHSGTLSFCRYLTDEMNAGYFFSDAPPSALLAAGNSIGQMLFVLTQLIISLTPQARIRVLDPINRQRITETLEKCREVSQRMVDRARDAEVRQRFQAVANTCTALAQSFFAVPVAEAEAAPPDQVLGKADQPQG